MNFFKFRSQTGTSSAETQVAAATAESTNEAVTAITDNALNTELTESVAPAAGNSGNSMTSRAVSSMGSALGSISAMAHKASVAAGAGADNALASCMKCTEPTPELVAAFPLHKGGADSRLRHEPYHKEDNTLRGIKCGFCYKGEIVRMIIGAIVDVDGTPSIKVIIDHKRVPAAYSTHILPIGKQEIPLPFLSIACPGVCVLGIVLVVHSRLLKDLEEVTDFASNSSATLYEDAEGVTPVAAKNTLDICSYKFMSVDMGVAFEMADYFVGVISTTIPDPPIHLSHSVISLDVKSLSVAELRKSLPSSEAMKEMSLKTLKSASESVATSATHSVALAK